LKLGLVFFGIAAGCLTLVINRGDGKLKYFKPSEFGRWWESMAPGQLSALDKFRELWGYPVRISPMAGAVGRNLGPHDTSQHNVDKWGEVRATDFFPMLPDGKGGWRYMQTAVERKRAFEVAKAAGFTGIGIYTDTYPGNMVHGDVREASQLAKWSRVGGAYMGIDEAWA